MDAKVQLINQSENYYPFEKHIYNPDLILFNNRLKFVTFPTKS